jgi:predicted transcriptional regulator
MLSRYLGGVTMKRVLIYLSEELHAGLREIAHRRKTSMSDLMRRAAEELYVDELDAVDMERELEEYARDPGSAMSWEEFKASLKRSVQA